MDAFWYTMEANTIGIEILPRVSRSQFPGIKRSKNRLLAALSDFCWIARQNRPAGITDSPHNNALHQTRHHDDLVAPSPLCGLVIASVLPRRSPCCRSPRSAPPIAHKSVDRRHCAPASDRSRPGPMPVVSPGRLGRPCSLFPEAP